MPNELFLIDTSVWIEVLPGRRANDALRRRVDALLAADRVAVTGMVRLELLGGARTQADWRRLDDLLSALHQLPTDDPHWDDAAQMAFQLRRGGVTVPSTDLLIAAVSARAGAVLLHRDHHFDLMAAHLPITVESHRA
jgi:predicted nucleic acid-binding protein